MRKFAASLAAAALALCMGTVAMAESYDYTAFKWNSCTVTNGEVTVSKGNYTNVSTLQKIYILTQS